MTTSTPVAQQRFTDKSSEDDATNASDSDTNSETDPVIQDVRSSTEIAVHDRELLDEEEEREKLLTAASTGAAQSRFTGRGYKNGQAHNAVQEGKKTTNRSKRRRRHERGESRDEEGELLYEMEEGGARDETSSQASSSSLELNRMNFQGRPTSRRRRNTYCLIISASIALLFAALTFGAYKVSQNSSVPLEAALLSNGTSEFAPTTILISLDGFRADFLQRGITPTLNQFIAEGVSPRYMLPSFPSVTFPNHYTLVTGLFPESHGVVGNTFWDPDLKEEFFYTDPARSMQPKWWAQGEPLWVTAEKQDVKTGIHMWPGSEAGMEFTATYLDKFNGSEILARKTERILELLDLPSKEENSKRSRPQLIASYVPVIDADGHRYGPNSTEIWNTISSVDTMLHNTFAGLHDRNLTELVNVVVVSDHGMATTSTDRLIQLDNLIDLNLVEHIDGWPLYGLRPKDPVDVRGLYDRLLVEAEQNPNFDVYLKDVDMPSRYHFSNNDRIAPLWIVPKTGWAIVKKVDFDVEEARAKGLAYDPAGLHGYDYEHPLMRAIFVARGPAFPHKPNSRLEVFQNTEVYNIVCDSLGIEPKPNNGTLRLPLKPIGLHSDEPNSPDNVPVDFSPNSKATPDVEGPPVPHENDVVNDTDVSNDKDSNAELNDFWAYMKAKMKAAMDWAHKTMAGLKNSGKENTHGES